ncbi:hypothetical protein PNOK_0153600 [Pyrrhoderma noxium]|uniref:Uncharacterized protein n=1 Tax=Pyrrhoderma noxium TaxID=2282107 RepID=A0A286UPW7_9AGAM|nr:hypothetical protein PNOK_0153600 [Pyrrhoderma noxium]
MIEAIVGNIDILITKIGREFEGNVKKETDGFKIRLDGLTRDLDVALLIQLDIKVGGTDENTTDIKEESDAFEKIDEKVEYMLEMDENVLEASGLEANRPKFMSGTQVEILEKINPWTQETSYPNAPLLIGGIGTGKSTVAKTVAK